MMATAADTSVGDTDRAAAQATVRQATVGKAGVYLVLRVMWQAALGMLHAAGCSQDISRKRHVIIFEKDRHGNRRESVSSERFRSWMLKSVFGLNPQGSLDAKRRVSDQYANRIAQVLVQAQSKSITAQSSFNHHGTVQGPSGEGDAGEEAVRHADTASVSQNVTQPRRSKRKHHDGNDGQDSQEAAADQDSARASSTSTNATRLKFQTGWFTFSNIRSDSARASSTSTLLPVEVPKNLHRAPAGLKTSEPRYPRLKIDMVTSQP